MSFGETWSLVFKVFFFFFLRSLTRGARGASQPGAEIFLCGASVRLELEHLHTATRNVKIGARSFVEQKSGRVGIDSRRISPNRCSRRS
jgi:hypothetical protein